MLTTVNGWFWSMTQKVDLPRYHYGISPSM
jgi:hypothetical protein